MLSPLPSPSAPRSSSTTSSIQPPTRKKHTYTPSLLPRAQCRLLSPGLCCWKGPASGLHWQRRLIPQLHTHTHTHTLAHKPGHTHTHSRPRSKLPSWIPFKCTQTRAHSPTSIKTKNRGTRRILPSLHPNSFILALFLQAADHSKSTSPFPLFTPPHPL